MKKLLVVLTMLATVAGAVFAKENNLEVSAGMNLTSNSAYSETSLAISLHSYTMNNDMFGVSQTFTYFIPQTQKDKETGDKVSFKALRQFGLKSISFDASTGVAIRPIDSSLSLVVTPGIAYGLKYLTVPESYSDLLFTLGPSVGVAAGYKLTDHIILTGNLDLTLYIYGFGVNSNYGLVYGKATSLSVTPTAGVTFRF